LTDARRELVESGFTIIRALLDSAAVDGLRDCMAALLESGAPKSREILYTHVAPPEDAKGLDRLMLQWLNPTRGLASVREAATRAGAAVVAVAGEPLFMFQDMLMEKLPNHGTFHAHQDEPFWPLTARLGVVVWCALDPSTSANGAVELAPGSHAAGLGPSIDLHTGASQQGSEGCVPPLEALQWTCPDLATGDALIFMARLWHRSGPNASGHRRRAWSSSWLSLDARWDPARAPRHPLARKVEAGRLVSETRL